MVNMKIGENYRAMPPVLRVGTLCALAFSLTTISTIFPGVPIRLFGRAITHSEWWTVGAGQFMLTVATLMLTATIMVTVRYRYARFAVIIAMVALDISVPFLGAITKTEISEVDSGLIMFVLLTLATTAYLYFGGGSKNYFFDSQK